MITREEYKFLKKLKTEGSKWIARDKNWKLYRYSEMPKRCRTIWNFGGVAPNIQEEHFTFIKWEDEKPTKIDDLIKEYEQHEMLKRKAVIPQYVADFINKAKPIMGFYSAMYNLFHFGSDGAVRDWVEKNEETFARAWVNGYVIEEEKQYILKFSNGQYLYNCDLGMTDEALACKLTQPEIESVDPRLMQFAVEVE